MKKPVHKIVDQKLTQHFEAGKETLEDGLKRRGNQPKPLQDRVRDSIVEVKLLGNKNLSL